MRVLLVAPADGCSNLYLHRAFVAEGHVVEEFDYRQHFRALARVSSPQGALVALNSHFDRRVRAREHGEHAFDLVLILKGELLEPRVLRALSRDGYKIALWNFDPRDQREEWVVERAQNVSVFLTIARGLVPELVKQGVNAHWLLEAADPEIHRPVEGAVKQFPVSFVGTVEGVGDRAVWLERVANALPMDSLHLWGSFPEKMPGVTYHGRAEGDVGFCFVTSSTLVTLGYDRNPEIERSFGARLFRTLAAGGFLLTNATVGIKEDFGGAVAVYENDESCTEQLRYWLGNPEERERVAARGRALVHARHTWRHRVREIEKIVEVS